MSSRVNTKHCAVSTGNISAVKFTIHPVDEHSVLVNITDPITSIYRQQQQQLSIRDVLRKELKYKISYSKSGSTGKVKYSSTVPEVWRGLLDSPCSNGSHRETTSQTPMKPRSPSWMRDRVTASWWQRSSRPGPKAASWEPGVHTSAYRRHLVV